MALIQKPIKLQQMDKFKDLFKEQIKKDYSQNGEQAIILKELDGTIGTFLSLGENNGECLSNVRALALLGWSGVCVEPSKTPFEQLDLLYKNNDNVTCFNFAIGTSNGVADFYDSGLINGFDSFGLVSSLDSEQLKKWGRHTEFNKKQVDVFDFKTFLEKSPIKKFDFVSIDCENMDFEILSQMDLEELGVKCLIVESNSIENEKYVFYCGKFGLSLIHRNLENLIFCKKLHYI